VSDRPRPKTPPDPAAHAALLARIEDAIALLDAVIEDRALLVDVPEDARQRLLMSAGRVSRPARGEARKLAKAFRKKERHDVRAEDEAVLDDTGIRALRRAPVFPTPSLAATPPVPALAGGHDPISVPTPPRATPVRPAVTDTPPHDASGDPTRALHEPRKCYVCKAPFQFVHFFYDQLCARCAELNWNKRHQTADCRGRVALVTGARVKIGYQASILLLRAGAHVLATTRFPQDAARRYAREPDYAEWRDRLDVYGLDLRHTPSVESFARHVVDTYPRLDFILHNACQTVRRPPGFYAHLMDGEAQPLAALPAGEAQLLARHAGLVARQGTPHDAPALSQVPLLAEDHAPSALLFPAGQLDQDLQQVDLRALNSWRLTLAEVPTIELLEVQLVNAIAPFVLSARLKPLMARERTGDKHIVNVSAMEGQFYREHKTDKHPHTNMAKAALNMLTRTSAPDYVQDGIHMNSVDTGWVTDEDPAALAERKTEIHGFHPPLDIVDGAARIVDPIFHGLNTGEHLWGLFLKDYRPVPW
jgi:NAD(P)-dependent dehydrogenase (short-subunit alcohol dehydrogenase family)